MTDKEYKDWGDNFQTPEKICQFMLSNFRSFEHEKVEIEYAVYDTNVTHDAKWILGN